MISRSERYTTLSSRTNQNLPTTLNWWKNSQSTSLSRGVTLNIPTDKSNQFQTKKDYSTKKVSNEDEDEINVFREGTLDSKGDIVIDLEYEKMKKHEAMLLNQYKVMCERSGIVASSKLDKLLQQNHEDEDEKRDDIKNINLGNYGLNEMGVSVALTALWNVGQCTHLDLQGNALGRKSLKILSSMLTESMMEYLNLSNTNITRIGPRLLSSWLSSSKTIQKIIMQDNFFDDEDGRILFDSLSSNRSLKYLDLSRNRFFMQCGQELRGMIEDNDIIEELDLSWNNLRMAGAFGLSQGLKKNTGLKRLLISWNGFSDLGCMELGKSMEENESLETLDVASNRISDIGFGFLIKALESNTTLTELKLGYNIISQMAVHTVLDGLWPQGFLENCGLAKLDFTGSIFQSDLDLKVKELQDRREKTFVCTHGYPDPLHSGKKNWKPTNPVNDAVKTLTKYLTDRNLTLAELFESFEDGDEDSSSPGVSYERFKSGLKKAGVPLTESQLDRLIYYMDADGDGAIDFSELAIGSEKSNKSNNKNNSNIDVMKKKEVPNGKESVNEIERNEEDEENDKIPNDDVLIEDEISQNYEESIKELEDNHDDDKEDDTISNKNDVEEEVLSNNGEIYSDGGGEDKILNDGDEKSIVLSEENKINEENSDKLQ